MTRLLAAGHYTVGLDPSPAPDAARRHVIDDLSDRRRLDDLLRMEQISHVIHCGGVSGPMVLAEDPARVMDINVAGSLNLLQGSLKCSVKTFIYCSSVSAVGEFYELEPIDADYPLRPMSAYGSSKAAMDMVLRGLWRRVPLDLCSLRFTSIYGPGRRTRFVVDDIVDAAVQGTPALVKPAATGPTSMSTMRRTPQWRPAFRRGEASFTILWLFPNRSRLRISRRPRRKRAGRCNSRLTLRARPFNAARSTSVRRSVISALRR